MDMDEQVKKDISLDRQIRKFSLYGFFKNLKFYEPYLLVILMDKGISLFQIGILFAVREIVINVFEIPSGMIADIYGRKKELSVCFIFYIVSFILFFLTNGMPLAIVAMFFYGLGDAFRTGTHKAIIYSYLETKGWSKYKGYVYGKTRSVSLIGSALSSLLSILIILNLPTSNYIFLASISPYLIDFFIILSYPDEKIEYNKSVRAGFKEKINSLKIGFKNNVVFRTMMIRQAIFEAGVSSVKDFIQPILNAIIISSGFLVFKDISADNNLKVLLGLTYSLIFLFSSVASRISYRFQKYDYLKKSYIIFMATLFMISIVIDTYIAVIMLFLVIQFLQNSRKPVFVATIDEYIHKNDRATVLSVSSQLKSIFIVLMAPLLGYCYDHYGPRYSIILLAIILLLVYIKPLNLFIRRKI